MSVGFGAGTGDGTPAGGIRDAHAHVIARMQQTKKFFTSFRTLMIAVCPMTTFSFTRDVPVATRC